MAIKIQGNFILGITAIYLSASLLHILWKTASHLRSLH